MKRFFAAFIGIVLLLTSIQLDAFAVQDTEQEVTTDIEEVVSFESELDEDNSASEETQEELVEESKESEQEPDTIEITTSETEETTEEKTTLEEERSFDVSENNIKNEVSATNSSSWLSDYNYYVDTTNQYVRLDKYIGDSKNMFIPSSTVIDGKQYKVAIRYIRGDNSETVETVKFEDGVIMLSGDITFNGMTNLRSVDFGKIDTSQVHSMSGMFSYCENLVEIKGIENFNTSKVTDMERMFIGCPNLSSVDVSHFDTQKVEKMNQMFSGCESLVNIDVSHFNTSQVNDMSDMFMGCYSLVSVDVSSFNTSQVTDISRMFFYCEDLKQLTGIENFDTNQVTDMRNLFTGCKSLEILNISNFSTPKLLHTAAMFEMCSKLKKLDLSRMDLSKIKDFNEYSNGLERFFASCVNLEELKLFTFSGNNNIKTTANMFSGCRKLKKINFSNFDNSHITDMHGMFSGCSNLQEIICGPQFTFSQAVNTAEMFASCEKLTTLPWDKFSELKSTDMSRMFACCYKLETMNISKITILPNTNVSDMVSKCFLLKTIQTPVNIPAGVEIVLPYNFYEWDSTNNCMKGNAYPILPQGESVSMKLVAIPLERIGVSPETFEMNVGQTRNITASLQPTDATLKSKELRWESDNPSVATVEDGLIKAVASGKAYIRVYADNNQSGTSVVTVKKSGAVSQYPLKSISLNKTALTLEKEESETLMVSYLPSNTTDSKTVTWSSSNAKVATVDSTGKVTAISAGTAKIQAKVGSKTANCTLTVTAALEEIQLNQENVTLYPGDSYSLAVHYLPQDTTDSRAVTWSSSAPELVSVDSKGNIQAIGKGTATITAISEKDASITDSCQVTVTTNVITFDSQGGSDMESIECGRNETIVTTNQIPEQEGYLFTGWYCDSACTQKWVDTNLVTEDITLYAGWIEPEEDFWVMELTAYPYSGKAIKPIVEVYDGTTKLTIKKDYTVTYKNNTNVYTGEEESKKPQVIVKGIGNYSGTQIVPFTIEPKDLSDEDVTAADLYKKTNTRKQKLLPAVYWGTKKLTYHTTESKSSYRLVYGEGNYTDAGTYTITIEGVGNYTGSRTCSLFLTEEALMEKASVKITSSMPYQDGEEVEPTVLTVKMGKTLLIKDTDYTVSYQNNIEVGTATAVLTGIGNYAGIKKVSYKITGQKLSQAKITGIGNREYNGNPIYQSYTVATKKETLHLHEDFEVTYQKNTNVGTATLLFTGIGNYTGTVKKTFKITPYSLKKNGAGYFVNDASDMSVAYEKGGSKPDVNVTFRGRTLIQGKDYTLSYKNNTAVNNGTNAKKMPTITIKGKGDFKDSVMKNFTITTGDLQTEEVTVATKDVVYKNKKNAYKSTPVIWDSNGKKLTAGTDYSKTYEYHYEDENGAIIGVNEIPAAGSILYVKVSGIKNYAGSSIGTTYRVVSKSLAKAKVTVAPQIYTGSPITITKEDIISIKIGKTVLGAEDYEILPNTYSNNIKKGTAKVTIRGCGDYGQEKVITFKIQSKAVQ